MKKTGMISHTTKACYEPGRGDISHQSGVTWDGQVWQSIPYIHCMRSPEMTYNSQVWHGIGTDNTPTPYRHMGWYVWAGMTSHTIQTWHEMGITHNTPILQRHGTRWEQITPPHHTRMALNGYGLHTHTTQAWMASHTEYMVWYVAEMTSHISKVTSRRIYSVKYWNHNKKNSRVTKHHFIY